MKINSEIFDVADLGEVTSYTLSMYASSTPLCKLIDSPPHNFSVCTDMNVSLSVTIDPGCAEAEPQGRWYIVGRGGDKREYTLVQIN